MENASKALIMAAGVLIGIVILSFMLYIFRRFEITSRETDNRFSEREIEAFNAKFEGYETGGNHNTDDTISVTYARTNYSGTWVTKEAKYSELFRSAPNSVESSNEEVYNRLLLAASKSLNTASDVVTAINDAIDINDRNNNSYKYSTGSDSLEVQNSVEIIVDLNGYQNSFNFFAKNGVSGACKYLVIEPNKNVEAKFIYGQNNINTSSSNNTENKNNNVESFDTSKKINVYDILTELRETKIVKTDMQTASVYQYYFIGQTFINEYTNLIETVKFTLIKDQNF